MVTDLVRLSSMLNRAEKEKLPEDVINHLKQLGQEILADKIKNRRQPRPPAPEGGISICAAARKYTIPDPTICRWVKSQYISVVKKTDYETFIDEPRLSVLAEVYHSDPGRGSWAVKRFILQEHNS
jgi:hypothetical protein